MIFYRFKIPPHFLEFGFSLDEDNPITCFLELLIEKKGLFETYKNELIDYFSYIQTENLETANNNLQVLEIVIFKALKKNLESYIDLYLKVYNAIVE